MLHALPLVHDDHYEVYMYTALLTLSFHGLFRLGELALLEDVIEFENVHIGTHKATITLHSSKANHTGMAQQVTVKGTHIACPVKALMAFARIPIIGQANFLSDYGNPVLTQDIAHILNKLSNFLNLPQQLIKTHSHRIIGSTHLYLSGHTLQHIQQKGR